MNYGMIKPQLSGTVLREVSRKAQIEPDYPLVPHPLSLSLRRIWKPRPRNSHPFIPSRAWSPLKCLQETHRPGPCILQGEVPWKERPELPGVENLAQEPTGHGLPIGPPSRLTKGPFK